MPGQPDHAIHKSVAGQILLGFVLFALPVVFLAAQLIHSHVARISFTKQERHGAQMLPYALKTHAAAVQANSDWAARRPVSSDAELHLYQLSQRFRDAGWGTALQPEVDALRTALAAARAGGPYNPAVARKITAASRHIITRIGEDSKLILDPELESFYLMELAILRIPLLIERTGYLGNAVIGLRTESDVRATLIATHVGRLETAEQEYWRAIEAASRVETDRSTVSEFGTINAKLRQELEALTRADQASAARHDTNARQILLGAALKASSDLSAKLQQRIDRLRGELLLVLAATLALFSIAAVIVLRMIRAGVVRPLTRLTRAMRTVADGDLRGALAIDPPDLNRSDELGDMARALGIFRQTALDRIAADEAAKARAEFLAVMSHEIRTPLNGVLGMTQALASTQLDKAQARMVDVVLSSGQTLLTLLNDILDLSKIEAGRLELEQAPFDPRELVLSVRDLFDERATAKGLLLRAEVPDGDLGWRRGDAQRLRQVLFNLVSNAVKFTAAGEVVIRLEAPGADRLVLEVEDTGIGIPPDRMHRLFNRFTQVDVSHARIYGGTGLGLSIAQALAQAMGGAISVTSREGRGSTFRALVTAPPAVAPASTQTPAQALARSAEADPLESAGQIRILVAEDNATNRFVIQTLFDQIGLAPDFAEDGKLAFEAWQQQIYDVILMDMQMPVWDGLTSIRAIRAAEAETGRARTAIVTLTANAMVHQIQQQLDAGADTHAPKPIQMPQLLAAIDEALAKCESGPDRAGQPAAAAA